MSVETNSENETVLTWRCIFCGEIKEVVKKWGTTTQELHPDHCGHCGSDGDIYVQEDMPEYGQNQFKGTVVIVGAGLAGVKVAETIRKVNKSCKVVLFSGEKVLPYYRPGVTKKELKNLHPKEWYVENDIELILEEIVSSNYCKDDMSRKEVVSSSGKTYPFDKLVLAQGSVAQNKWKDAVNTFPVYTPRDLERILGFMEKNGAVKKMKVVVVGAGLLGVEISEVICRRMKEKIDSIILLEFFNRILPNQFDVEGGEILANHLSKHGLDVRTNSGVRDVVFSTIDGEKVVSEVICLSGQVIPCDILVVSTGTAPCLEIAKQIGVDLSKDGRCVQVNERMETSVPQVYAVGNIAQTGNFCVPNVLNAIIKGEVCAYNILDIQKDFVLPLAPFVIHSFDFEAFSCGQIKTEHHLVKRDGATYLRLCFAKDKDNVSRLVGMLSLGGTIGGAKFIQALFKKYTMERACLEFLYH